jgi:hypothetical protein
MTSSSAPELRPNKVPLETLCPGASGTASAVCTDRWTFSVGGEIHLSSIALANHCVLPRYHGLHQE